MKTSEWLLNEFKKVKLGESADGTPYYLGTDNKDELQCCVDIAQEYSKENLREEYIQFLDWNKYSTSKRIAELINFDEYLKQKQ